MDGYWRCAVPTPLRRFAVWGSVVAGIAAGSNLVADVARAESLFDSLVSAYVYNPSLKAARAGLRATDEGVTQARSGWRPTIIATGELVYSDNDDDPGAATDGDRHTQTYGVSVTQSLFRGFRTINSVRQAEADVRAGRQDLKNVEQTTLLAAATAYMDVVRDRAIVRLRQSNTSVLSEQLRATRDRFKVGSITKTDVAQAEARLSRARSEVSLAKSNLKVSAAAYKRVVGYAPRGLGHPGSVSHILPSSLDAAIVVGMEENPEIIAAEFRAKSSRHAVDVARGELLPEVEVEASYAKSYEPSLMFDENETATVTGRLRVPLYQGGAVKSRVRASKQTYWQSRDLIDEARDSVRADIVSAWSKLVSARATLVSDRAQVAANETALAGVKQEEKVGQRTVLDVLDAEQEKVTSQVSLAITRRDLVVASFEVLSSVGRLTALDLGLSVEVYDPTEHYHDVRRKWFGVGDRLPRD